MGMAGGGAPLSRPLVAVVETVVAVVTVAAVGAARKAAVGAARKSARPG